MTRPDAVVVGSGPNGLAAAIELARAGWSVTVFERDGEIGGGTRTAELTLPGHAHDVCAAVHPMGIASPFLRCLPLEDLGVRWVQPVSPLAHPLDDRPAAVLDRDVDRTARGLGADADAYRTAMGRSVRLVEHALPDLLRPALRLPRHPVATGRFGLRALRSATATATGTFADEPAQALFAGLAAHAILPLDRPMTAGVAWMMGALAHRVGWPFVLRGSHSLSAAMARHLLDLGGEIVVDHEVRSLADVPDARAVLFDVTPEQLLRIAGDRFPERYRRRLTTFRRGPGVHKVDWVLDGPIPWSDPAVAGAGTVHLGGTLAEVAAAEADVHAGRVPERPFVLLAQPSNFDPTRAPAGHHTVWAYCHVPNGCELDVTAAIEAQVERFAPGFRDRILATSVHGPAAMERYNPNYLGGDISGGASDLRQHLARPILSATPYATPDPQLWLCSSSTPPGAGVHGMCGANAAAAVLRRSGARRAQRPGAQRDQGTQHDGEAERELPDRDGAAPDLELR